MRFGHSLLPRPTRTRRFTGRTQPWQRLQCSALAVRCSDSRVQGGSSTEQAQQSWTSKWLCSFLNPRNHAFGSQQLSSECFYLVCFGAIVTAEKKQERGMTAPAALSFSPGLVCKPTGSLAHRSHHGDRKTLIGG